MTLRTRISSLGSHSKFNYYIGTHRLSGGVAQLGTRCIGLGLEDLGGIYTSRYFVLFRINGPPTSENASLAFEVYNNKL